MTDEYAVAVQTFTVQVAVDLDRSSEDPIVHLPRRTPKFTGRALTEDVGRGVTD